MVKTNNPILTEKSKAPIVEQIISGIVTAALLWIFNWVAPQIKIAVGFDSLAGFSFVLYIMVNFDAISHFIDSFGILKSQSIARMAGGAFWVFAGAMLIELEYTGKSDPTINPLNYVLGGLLVLIGFLQIVDRYELTKRAISMVVGGADYPAERMWDDLVSEASDDLDEGLKTEIINKAAIRLERMKRSGEIDNSVYEKIKKIKNADEKLSYEDFSKKYLEDPNAWMKKSNIS